MMENISLDKDSLESVRLCRSNKKSIDNLISKSKISKYIF